MVMPGSLLISALSFCTPYFVKPSNPSRSLAHPSLTPFLLPSSPFDTSFSLPAKEAAALQLLNSTARPARRAQELRLQAAFLASVQLPNFMELRHLFLYQLRLESGQGNQRDRLAHAAIL